MATMTQRKAKKLAEFYSDAAKEWREGKEEATDPQWYEKMAQWNDDQAKALRELLPTLPE